MEPWLMAALDAQRDTSHASSEPTSPMFYIVMLAIVLTIVGATYRATRW